YRVGGRQSIDPIEHACYDLGTRTAHPIIEGGYLMGKRVVVLVGTTKGTFFFHSDEGRQDWTVTGPHLAGWSTYSILGDSRHGHRVYAGTNPFVYGTTVRMSDDFGANWVEVPQSPSYTAESGHKMNSIWQIVPGHVSQPDTLYAGVDEAALFR